MAREPLFQSCRIACSDGELLADLVIPQAAMGVVLFAHGSGSNRQSPRNRAVAAALQQAGLATLLLDLLPAQATPQPGLGCALDQARCNLLTAVDWTGTDPRLSALPLGLFGASSGAATALDVAALRPERVRAVVCRGGRPDLAFEALGLVRCPTLLIVGSQDVDVLELNAWAAAHLRTRHDLLVIPAAGHLFAEPGALEAVAAASCSWFVDQLPRG